MNKVDKVVEWINTIGCRPFGHYRYCVWAIHRQQGMAINIEAWEPIRTGSVTRNLIHNSVIINKGDVMLTEDKDITKYILDRAKWLVNFAVLQVFLKKIGVEVENNNCGE